mmetsp:Transcript_5334/g.12846  ORF Transcript_5334/g.12846 Transcript_5334/m.12846 type:complete len:403 (+) Transcript_5334:78-1286(+)
MSAAAADSLSSVAAILEDISEWLLCVLPPHHPHPPPPGQPEKHIILAAIAGTMVLCTCVSSGVLICRHLRAEGSDEVVAVTVRILLMAPFYAIQAQLALLERYEGFNTVLEFVRKLYECITLVAFLQLNILLLGGMHGVLEVLQEEQCTHLPPVRWVLPADAWKPKAVFLRWSIRSVLAYVPVTLFVWLMVSIAFFAFPDHAQHDAKVNVLPKGQGFRHPTVWSLIQMFCVGLTNLFQCLAMYGLVVLCHAVHRVLSAYRPIQKLLCIKMLVFFTVWQAFCVHAAERLGFFDHFAAESVSGWTSRQIAEGSLNFLLCFEMMALALVHHCVYPPDQDEVLNQQAGFGNGRACRRAKLVLDLRDIYRFYRQLMQTTQAHLDRFSTDSDDVAEAISGAVTPCEET